MPIEGQYQSDVDTIVSHRYDLGGDLWTTQDKRILKGSPFSTLGSVQLLLELGMEPENELLRKAADLIFSTWQPDGRFKVYPTGAIYPCQTAHALNTLCLLGYTLDSRIQKTYQHLLEIQNTDGGWRCKKFSYGKGPETEYSNPFPTLIALNAFRLSDTFKREVVLEKAVEFLLTHWTIKKPIGPCHYGMGTRFMQIEYPFSNYNLFIYVYVLSFYSQVRRDNRFLEALECLELKLQNGSIVVERNGPKLANFLFCKRGEPSFLATKRYHEILRNLGRLV